MSNFSQRLDIRQSQNLVMTPQLQQAIKLLQLNNLELAEFVEDEIAQNPLLEKAEGDEDAAVAGGDDRSPGPEGPDSDPVLSQDHASRQEGAGAEDRDPYAADTGISGDSENGETDFDPGSAMAGAGSGGSHNFDAPEDSFENTMAREATLRDHLLEQLHVDVQDPRDRMIGALLIDALDESGYLRASCDELSQRLGCSPERIERLLGLLKKFDPAGAFACDLKECLALQLADRDLLDLPMEVFLDNLDMLADHDLAGLAKKCGVNETYLQDMIADIQALNPKPAASFEDLTVQTAVPDILMKRLPKTLGGGWRVELNSETLPRVLINQDYYTRVCQSAKDKKDKDYIASKMNAANWLTRALDQRAQTILKVAAEIVEQQDGFFNYGIEFLKPLTLKDVAEAIEMHESTVSRVTTNKYIGTPRGIFELKYFFTAAISSASGTCAHSAESVKAKIKAMIDAEEPGKILSDDKIVALLKEENIDIARRTVAKYREAMHIPSSVRRRRQKQNAGG